MRSAQIEPFQHQAELSRIHFHVALTVARLARNAKCPTLKPLVQQYKPGTVPYQ